MTVQTNSFNNLLAMQNIPETLQLRSRTVIRSEVLPKKRKPKVSIKPPIELAQPEPPFKLVLPKNDRPLWHFRDCYNPSADGLGLIPIKHLQDKNLVQTKTDILLEEETTQSLVRRFLSVAFRIGQVMKVFVDRLHSFTEYVLRIQSQ